MLRRQWLVFRGRVQKLEAVKIRKGTLSVVRRALVLYRQSGLYHAESHCELARNKLFYNAAMESRFFMLISKVCSIETMSSILPQLLSLVGARIFMAILILILIPIPNNMSRFAQHPPHCESRNLALNATYSL